jgi:flagellar biosynthesis chaperone FliJ
MTRTLAAVLRLRRLELEAERAHAEARAALQREARGVADDALLTLQNFADWLPRGQALRQTAASAVQRAAATAVAARKILAERQAALRAAEALADEERQRARQAASRREVHALDDIVRGRRG